MKLKEVRPINNFICFDLEELLSPQDNAYGLMKLIPGGRISCLRLSAAMTTC